MKVHMIARTVPRWIVAMCLAACSGPPVTDASDNDASREVSVTDSSLDGDVDDGSTQDAWTMDSASCTPSDAGSLQQGYYCDLAVIHVIERSSGPPIVIVQARLGSESVPCGAIDSVDVLFGQEVLARLGPNPSVTLGKQYAVIASGEAPASLVNQCGNEMTRLSMYGLLIRGRDANGPFEARCGRAEFGSRWPPGTSLACHRNVPKPPAGLGSLLVMQTGAMQTASFDLVLPHASGAPVATRIDSTVRIVSPERPSFEPDPLLSSRDTGPWVSFVSESHSDVFGPITQVSIRYMGSPVFDTSLCPPATAMSRPWFLVRVTGQGPSGPMTAEVLAHCLFN